MLRLPLFCLLTAASLFPGFALANTAKQDQTINLRLDTNGNYFSGGRTYDFRPSASSNLDVTVVSRTTGTCTVSSSRDKKGTLVATLTTVAAGTCTVAGDQAGDTNWNAAPEVTASITISTPPPAPGVPTAIMAIPGDLTANISFLPPANTGGAGIAITSYQFTCDGGNQSITSFWNSNSTEPPTPSTLNFNYGNPSPCVDAPIINIQIRALNIGGPGPWSDPVTVTIGTDSDQDSISDAYEDQACAGGDCNGDGIPDKNQNTVSTVATPDGKNYINVACTDCTNGEQIIRTISAATPSDFPATSSAPYSGIAFWLQRINPFGSTYHLELNVPANSANPITGLLKKNYRTGNWDNIATSVTTTGGRTKIAYTLTDGDDYDADRSADGKIVDPAFAATAATTSSTDGGALAGWMLMPLLSAVWLRRRRARLQRKN